MNNEDLNKKCESIYRKQINKIKNYINDRKILRNLKRSLKDMEVKK